MKFGMSSYCLTPAMSQGQMQIEDVIAFAKQRGCAHLELVPFYLPIVREAEGALDEELIEKIKDCAARRDIELSTYSVNADLLKESRSDYEAELTRVKLHIDAASRLGLSWMRHDLAAFRRPFSMCTSSHFEQCFEHLVSATRLLCDYAADKGVSTTLENHGFFCNGSDRVLRILEAVDRPQMRMTLDVGNFMCVDEYPLAAVKKCLPWAQIIHLKDFYVRPKQALPGQNEMYNCNGGSWFESLSGTLLRGSITGQGDLPVAQIVREIVRSGFDGYVSVEFEGMEPCVRGTEISLDMARALFEVGLNHEKL